MKKIIAFSLCICLVFGSFSFAFAAVSDQQAATITTNTTNIANALKYNNTSLASMVNSLYNYVYNSMPTFTQVSSTNQYLSNAVTYLTNLSSVFYSGQYSYSGSHSNYNFPQLVNLIAGRMQTVNQYLSAISSALADGSGGTIASILSDILAEFTSTTAGGSVLHFFSRIDTNVSSTKTLTNDIKTILNALSPTVTSIDTNIGNIYTLENSTLPGIYAYSGSIDSTLTTYQPYLLSLYGLDNVAGMSVLSGGSAITIRQLYNDGTLNDNTVNLSNKNWRDNVAYLMWNVNNNLTRGVSMTVGNYSDTQTRTSWLNNQQQTFTPTSFAKGIYYWLSSIQTPIARLAYVHASDQEIQAREKAASNQAALVTNFVDSNGSGSVPSSSFGSLAGLSSSYKTNFNSDVAPTRLFDVFNPDRGTWFSQETADQLDSTSSSQRSRSESSFETPLLDKKINEIYEEIGVRK